MKIREWKHSDLEKTVRFLIHLDTVEWSKKSDAAGIRAELEFRIAQKTTSSTSIIATNEEDEIIGYGTVNWIPCFVLPGIEAYVSELFVDQDARGKGAGKSILEEMEKRAKEKGCFRLMLMNIRERESYKRSFYPKNGWTERPGVANMVKVLKSG